jgi:hypothetical protein
MATVLFNVLLKGLQGIRFGLGRGLQIGRPGRASDVVRKKVASNG